VHIMTAVASLLLIAALAPAEKGQKAVAERTDADALKAEIEALQAPRVAWREIAWKSCLIEGLKESRDKKKPVVLWVFIDRPADDGRC
jgi:hypothetical protein